MAKIEFNGLPSSKKSLSKHTNMELHSYMRRLANEANKRIKAINKRGLRELSPTYVRKYDPMLYGNTITNLATTKGMFSTAKSAKANMVMRIQTLENFLRNPYTTVERTEAYVNNLLQQTGLNSEEDLKTMFEVYRDYGYDDYKDDSDKIIEIFSEMLNKKYDIRKVADFLEKNRDTFVDQANEIDVLERISNTTDIHSAIAQRAGHDSSPDQILNRVLESYKRRGI